MKRISILTFLMLFATAAYAYDCDSRIVDNAGTLRGHESQIMQAMTKLVNEGADPRVVTDNPAMTPEQYVDIYRRVCPSWQAAGGGVKNNLVVFLVFPKNHKIGLFLGSEFGKAVNTSQIRSQFMAPGFKDGDYARGFIAGINETAVQIEAFQSAPLHPATTVVNQQATDLHGFWIFLYCLIGLTLIGSGIWFVFFLRRRIAERKDAQQAAVQARNDAASRIRANPDLPDAEDFAKMAGSETWNPDADGLTVEQYNRIAVRYNAIAVRKTVNPYAKPRPQDSVRPDSGQAQPNTGQANTTYVDRSTTTVINNDPGYIPVPVIIDDGPRYESPRYEEPAPVRELDPEPVSSWSGGSSDYSSDSGSSWSDSSSSSDFSSGSSDSSGGSSDF